MEMNLNEALNNFGVAIGDLKRAFAEEYSANPNYVAIHIDEGDDVTIFSTDRRGSWTPIHREWVDTDEKGD